MVPGGTSFRAAGEIDFPVYAGWNQLVVVSKDCKETDERNSQLD